MNAAFLLMTTTWFSAGQVPATPVPATPAPAAPVVAACGGGCGIGCSDPCGCDSFGQRLREHLRGLLARRECCAPVVAQPVCPKVISCIQPRCDRPVREWHWPVLFNRDCRVPAPAACAPVRAPVCNTCNTCNTCSDPCGPSILERIRAHFRHNDCNVCGNATVVPPTEKINQPVPGGNSKPMPNASTINQGPLPSPVTTIENSQPPIIPSTVIPGTEH